MSKENIERMKKLIEDKKKTSAEQGHGAEASTKKMPAYSRAFKTTKKGGSLNK